MHWRRNANNILALAHRQAHLIHPIRSWLPLNKMKMVNLMVVQTIPNWWSRQNCHGPMITLTLHLLAITILPFCPTDLWIWSHMLIKNDQREIHLYAPKFKFNYKATTTIPERTIWLTRNDSVWEKKVDSRGLAPAAGTIKRENLRRMEGEASGLTQSETQSLTLIWALHLDNTET